MSKKEKKKDSKKVKKRKIKEIKKKKIIEKSELEKDIEDTEEKIENTEFREFLQPIKVSAPVLKRIESPIPESLELNIASSTSPQRREETGIDYVTNEPRYETTTTHNEDERRYESEFRPPILRQTDSSRFREEFLMPSREIGAERNDNEERIETNILEQKRREPFEAERKKYREVKFR